MKHVDVVAAIIFHDDKVLCVQRGESKFEYISRKYEFPGGKIEPGETNIDAIKREISEELKMEIEVQNDFMTVEHQYPDFRITMQCFKCSCAISRIVLTEHINYKWLSPSSLWSLDWAGADIPVVQRLIG